MIPLMLMLLAPQGQSAPFSLTDISAGVLANECRLADGRELDACVGFIAGLTDTLSMDHKLCLEGPSRTSQIIAVSRKFLRENPEVWDRPAAWVLRQHLVKLFPCR